jgi:hypothetical protein
VIPLDQPWNGDTAVRVLIGPLVFVGITASLLADLGLRSLAGGDGRRLS